MVDRDPPSTEPAANPPKSSSREPRADQPKSLAKIVHELRNPLSAFTSALHLLSAQPDRPDLVRQITGMLTQQLNQLTRVVDELAEHVANDKTPIVVEKKKPAQANGPLPNLKILLVDDNQSATHMMSRLLEKLGQNVSVAGSAAVALLQITNFNPDIVISDIAMPGMSGYDLARKIRELKLPNRPCLVAVTGHGQESDRQEAFAAGFDIHLTKPIGVSTLEDLLRDRKAPSAT